MLSCGGLSFGAPVAVGIVRFSTAQDKLFYLCRPYRALILAFPLPRATPWAISCRPVGAQERRAFRRGRELENLIRDGNVLN